MPCDSQGSVNLPRGAVGWSAAHDCGISRSYSLAFFLIAPACILLCALRDMCCKTLEYHQ